MAVNDCPIRAAQPADAAAVDLLLKASYPILMAPAYEEARLAPALELITRANPCLLASGTYYVAESPDGSVVGCGGWTMDRPGTGKIESRLGHLRHFATHPGWTNRGIGRAIYRLCETGARAAGVTAFECYSSLNAEGFYRALGFERIREISIELRPDLSFPGILMRRRV